MIKTASKIHQDSMMEQGEKGHKKADKPRKRINKLSFFDSMYALESFTPRKL